MDSAREQVTRILSSASAAGAELGDLRGRAAEELLPFVYDELHRLAAQRLRYEPPGGTLQTTALVNEAWLRLAGDEQRWSGKGHFFAAAALAMRRILVEHARARRRVKRGGGALRVEFTDGVAAREGPSLDLLALDEALDRLERHDARKARVVHLRYFAGLSLEESAAALEISLATVKSDWHYARAWLHRELERGAAESAGAA